MCSDCECSQDCYESANNGLVAKWRVDDLVRLDTQDVHLLAKLLSKARTANFVLGDVQHRNFQIPQSQHSTQFKNSYSANQCMQRS